jgi:hypothetical protein
MGEMGETAGAGNMRAGTCVGTPDTPDTPSSRPRCTAYAPCTGTPSSPPRGTPHRSGTPHLTGTPQTCASVSASTPWFSPGPAAPEARTFWHRGAEAEAAAAAAAGSRGVATDRAAPLEQELLARPQPPYQPSQPQLLGMLTKRGASLPWSWKRRAFHYDAARLELS